MVLRRPKIPPEAAGLADAIRRARPKGTDVEGVHVDALIAMAKRLGLDHVDLIERWDECR